MRHEMRWCRICKRSRHSHKPSVQPSGQFQSSLRVKGIKDLLVSRHICVLVHRKAKGSADPHDCLQARGGQELPAQDARQQVSTERLLRMWSVPVAPDLACLVLLQIRVQRGEPPVPDAALHPPCPGRREAGAHGRGRVPQARPIAPLPGTTRSTRLMSCQ